MRFNSAARTGAVATVVVALSTMALTACSPGASSNASPRSDAEKYSTVRIDQETQLTTIDPSVFTYFVDKRVMGLLHAPLFQFTKGSATETEGVLADSISSSSDLLEHRITLKKEITFSDGSPITAEVVANSLNRLKSSPPPANQDASLFETVTAGSDGTVIITTPIPIADLSIYLTIPTTGIIAAGIEDTNYFADQNAVYSGAYVPDGNILSSNRFTLKRNDAFGGAKPVVEELDFSVIADGVTATTRLRGGETDFVPSLPQESVAQMTGELTAGGNSGLTSEWIVPNNRPGSLFEDADLRKAVSWAIDRKALATVLSGPNAEPQTVMYPAPSDYPVSSNPFPEQDYDRARDLMKGTACESGCDVTVTYFSSNDWHARAAQVLQQQLEPIGIRVTAQPVETQQFFEDTMGGNFEIALSDMTGFNVPSAITSSLDTEGGTECLFSGCRNDEFMPALNALFGASDELEEAERSEKALEIFEEWLPIIPVASSYSNWGIRADLSDAISVQPNNLLWISTQD